MSAEPIEAQTPLVVQRWRRYGHDRAYVKRDDVDLGYRDMKTGEVCCSDASHVGIVGQATASMFERTESARRPDYQPRHAQPEVTLASNLSAPAPSVSPTLPDRDLALNRPGQSARDVAEHLRSVAPVRTLVARLVGVKTDERSWRIGADGEVEVARRLAKLGPEWRIVHAVPIGARDSDMDHVVIGPGGVFTINAKHHPDANVWVRGDTFKVNGSNQLYVRNSRHEAKRAAGLLSAAAGFAVEVRGIIAVVGARRGFTVVEQPRAGVAVVGRRDLVAYLTDEPAALGAPSIARIYEVARHLSTWQPSTVSRSDLP